MRIDPKSVERVSVPPPPPPAAEGKGPLPEAAARPAAGVSLSPSAQEIRAYQKAVAEAPAIREDLVAELKAAIATNRYHPPAEDLARKLLGG
jgi:flagellar biosynthesis anti-sigma factor FlgM